MTRTWRSWAPALAATGVIGAAALVGPVTANATVDLPDKTPAEVLTLAGSATADAFSGTVEQSSNLGLPDLSAPGGTAGLSPGGSATDTPEMAALGLLTGSYTAGVFVDRPDQARVQVLDQLGERNIIHNGTGVWFYDSEDNSAIHATVREHEAQHTPDLPTPDQLAGMFLDKIGTSTELSVGTDRMVAGRAAYELILTPRSEATLVGSVSIAVDGETGLPLSVVVTARSDGSTAFSAAFTEITYEAPDPSLFDFTPPADATVTEVDGHKAGTPERETDDGTRPTVAGSGWDAVVVVPAGDREVPEMLTQFSTPVEGGRLLETTLVTVLLTDDGRVLAGSVTPERLLQAAAGQ